MPKFSLERRVPSCLVTKELISALEEYLQLAMRKKLGDGLGDEIDYRISIKETIGTETLAGISEYTPNAFSDATREVEIRWSNGYQASCRLDIAIDFDSTYFLSKIKVDCTAPTAREIAIGIGDAILRVVDDYRTYNWVFNPFEFRDDHNRASGARSFRRGHRDSYFQSFTRLLFARRCRVP